jgi:hypothetical protein
MRQGTLRTDGRGTHGTALHPSCQSTGDATVALTLTHTDTHTQTYNPRMAIGRLSGWWEKKKREMKSKQIDDTNSI